MTKVSLIHGLFGYIGQDGPLRTNLKSQEGVEVVKFSFSDKLARGPLEEVSKRYIDHLHKEDIDVSIGLSMGGIISAHALETGGFDNKTAITLNSPWYGTKLANLCSNPLFKGITQLRTDSDFLADLREKAENGSIEYHCVYNPGDDFIIPGPNAKFEGAESTFEANPLGTKLLLPFQHYTTFRNSNVVDYCADIVQGLGK